MRLVLPVIVIALSLWPAAYAYSPNWQKFQPDGGGFTVEMPDKPELKIEERNGRKTYSALVAIDKAIAGDDLVFLVKYQEATKHSVSENEDVLDNVVKAIAEGGKLLSVNKDKLGGFPARRFAIEDADKDTSELRAVITDRYFVQAIFLGPAGNALGKRFLDSFAVGQP